MYTPTGKLLTTAAAHDFAVGGFNIYNLEGATAVVRAAEKDRSPVILQLLPSALALGGSPLIALCNELADSAVVPVGVHLDHCNSEDTIRFALRSRLVSIMADGSDLEFAENIQFTRKMCEMAAKFGGFVEAELGRLIGTEDGMEIGQRAACMTDPDQAVELVNSTGLGALAVCIGNVHGKYLSPPELDFDRLVYIRRRIDTPLVLHGTSGLPDDTIQQAITHGICKFNVNTEIRTSYLESLRESFATSSGPELVQVMEGAVSAMMEPVRAKLQLFCSANKAHLFT